MLRASPLIDIAKLGAEQPSMPTRRSLARHLFRWQPGSRAATDGRSRHIRTRLQMARHRQKARMFARAVVVQLARRLVADDQPVAFVTVVRARASRSLLIPLAKAQIRQPFPRHSDMQRRALMAGAGQRQMGRGQPHRIGGTGTPPAAAPGSSSRTTPGKDHPTRIAPAFHHLTGFITYDGMAPMGAFQHPASPQFNHLNCTHHGSAHIARFSARFSAGLSRIDVFRL